MHGDVRPAKILFAADSNSPRLADFGVAHATCLASGFGQSGVPFGHPEYLAPEVVQERLPRPTAQTDIYALGIFLYELCCGRVPHRGPNHRETLRRHFESPLPPPPEGVHVATALADVILRLTAKDPKKRVKDVKEALTLLEEYRRLRLAGKTSDEDGISRDDWGTKSEASNRPSGEWSADRIVKAERIGPEELTGDPDPESFEPTLMPPTPAMAAALKQMQQPSDQVAPRLEIKKKGLDWKVYALLGVVLCIAIGLLIFAFVHPFH
jgi:serine/threonine protein kinase